VVDITSARSRPPQHTRFDAPTPVRVMGFVGNQGVDDVRAASDGCSDQARIESSTIGCSWTVKPWACCLEEGTLDVNDDASTR